MKQKREIPQMLKVTILPAFPGSSRVAWGRREGGAIIAKGRSLKGKKTRKKGGSLKR